MERIGTQVKLPWSVAFQISLQGIRIRLGRALVTISGVVLGLAFFMSVITGEIIKDAVKQELELRQTVTLMSTMVNSEIGSVEGKRIAVAVFGTPTDADRRLIRQLLREKPKEMRAVGLRMAQVKAATLDNLTSGTTLLMVIGDKPEADMALLPLLAKMENKAVLDTQVGRQYADATSAGFKPPTAFFSAQTAEEKKALQTKAEQDRFRTIWIMSISLLVTIVGIANALLMSVTERFKEIGTMKCLGALSSFIRRLFLIESIVIGLVGSALGILLGMLIPMLIYGSTFGFALVMGSMNYGLLSLSALAALVIGTLLSMVAAIYPANFAARMVPAHALRSNV